MSIEIYQNDYEALYTFFNSIVDTNRVLFNRIIPFIHKGQYNRGETILNYGDIETRSNFVLKGVVHQFIYDELTVTTNLTPQGLPFNSLQSYMEKSPSLEVHEAITDVQLLYMEKEDQERLSKTDPEFCYLWLKIYENILLDRENRMYLLQHRSPQKRFRLFQEKVARCNWLLGGTPDKYIASYLNMTPQQYSKEKRIYYSAQ
ncbi:Crp/Fnr family transcriptional regulator [Marinilabilia salmonicolor]|jgi:CRP-like cAMP-binding protein|uniref:CRP-like cAMP-binding protein n=1 Tax=Marinilabilia salmonicolor TaxID=989 RepID=A0A368VCX2_9BACT|nr:Crp/Fnr family transcriptional regulator [Marinilabilia salmonicolor]RCW38962.1 CRP-like cAMP-binding protein [Marinilabilia salmonicolor]